MTNQNDDDEPRQVKPFAQWLQEQNHGEVHAEASEKLQELVRTCLELDKAGTLTLTVKCNPTGDGDAAFISADLKSTLPKPKSATALFYADAEGNLSRNDPRQAQLPLREVPAGVDPATGEVRDITPDNTQTMKEVTTP